MEKREADIMKTGHKFSISILESELKTYESSLIKSREGYRSMRFDVNRHINHKKNIITKINDLRSSIDILKKGS